MDKYIDRVAAGKVLAHELKEYANRDDVIVLALPRGGVPVAYEIAKALHAPLDVFIVRKLGVPGHAELAMGAIAMGDVMVLNEDILSSLRISANEIEAVKKEEQQELKRRERVYRGNHVFPPIKNKIVILVDDGIATGASMRAAIKALRILSPAKIIVAVPVADKMICNEMETLVNELVCPLRPVNLHAVGLWYNNFPQTEDEEVHELLRKAKRQE